ncbi:MAG TPA: neocarzinostatin apoprotein domain-containing protein [Acidimicrobiales bacterium]|nr:neocarzinostatin apoprotein domain-containing protein [Acidimicrobiales bacterium]
MFSVRKWTKGAATAVLVLASVTVGAAPAGSIAAVDATRAAPSASPALLEVTPSTGLIDDQLVTITAPTAALTSDDEYVAYLLCPAASTSLDDCAYLAFPDLGQTEVTVAVPARILTGDGESSVTVTDCRTTACELRAVIGGEVLTTSNGEVGDEPTLVAVAPVSFDPAATLRTPPSIAASPTTGLVDGQQIDVTVTPAADPTDPSDQGAITMVCTTPITSIAELTKVFSECDFAAPSTFEPIDVAGGSGFTVRAYIETAHGPVDCRAAGARCTIVAVDAVGQTDNVTLSFDPDAPAEPAVMLRPDGQFDGSKPMLFDVVGFTPVDSFTVQWCNENGDCLAGVLASGTLDAQGVGSFSFSSDPFPDIPDGDSTCSSMCYLTVRDAHGLTAIGPYGFGIGVPIPNEPFHSVRHPVTVTPNKGLGDGDTVTVTASGYRPGAEIVIIECAGQALTVGAGACDFDTSSVIRGHMVSADAKGNVSATYEIERYLQTDEGSFDCAKGNVDPDAYTQGIAADPTRNSTLDGGGYFSCIVAIADLTDYSESGGSPIAFEGAQFKKLPWEHDAPAPSRKARAATPVKAQPAFTG